MSHFRPFQISDLNYILDIDLKCYDEPLSLSQWGDLCQSPDAYNFVAVVEETPVGFVCWTVDDGYAVVLKLAVKSRFRNNGIGTLFLKYVDKYVLDNKLHGVKVIVSESMCYNPKVNISRWLRNRGAKAAMGSHNSCVSGNSVEDAIVFNFKPGGIT